MKTKIIALCVVIIALIGTGVWLLWPKENKPSPSTGGSSQQASKAPFIQLNILDNDLQQAKDSKAIRIGIQSSDLENIVKIEYLLDGKVAAESTASPFAVTIDISGLSEGDHTIQAVAYDNAGRSSKSEVFTFTIEPGQAPEPANNSSQAVLYQSRPTVKLAKASKGGSSQSGTDSGSGPTGNNGGGDSGGDNGGGNGENPLPDAPPAQICGNTSILNGPSSAPAGAVVVPAGDNSGVNFSLANTTYWFAPGTHTLGSGTFSQIGPGNNATFIGGPGAILDGQNLNNYAFSGKSTNVKIQHLTIKNFIAPRDEGIVNHNSGVGWTIEYNTAENNPNGGAVFAGTNNVVRYNCLKDNGQYGFQVYSDDPGGPQNVVLDHNEITGNNTHDWESIVNGCGCTGGGKFWDAHGVTVTNNYVHDNLSVGLWADTNDTDFLVEGNYIANNESQGLFYEISYNMIVRNNNFIGNAVSTGPSNNSFPSAAIYISESGGDSRVPGRTANIDIYNNKFTDNWAGVILWENADRFCSSPANTSSGTCTLVNPAATITTCGDPASGGMVDQEPYYSDCRWKTQNVKVHNNIFSLNRANVTGCTASSSCGYQGLFSNFGTFPTWSPYMGSVIQQAITFDQNNLFSNNTYLGEWNYMAKAQGNSYNFALWQARFGQDTGSTYNGESQYLVTNALDDDTATLEGSIGAWNDWFNTTLTQSTEQAHSGTHSLKATMSDAFWGIESAADGFPITPADKTVSFWGRAATSNVAIKMQVQFWDANSNPLGSTVEIPLTLTSAGWQQASQDIPTPAGAETVIVKFVGGSGPTSASFYLDDIVVADKAS